MGMSCNRALMALSVSVLALASACGGEGGRFYRDNTGEIGGLVTGLSLQAVMINQAVPSALMRGGQAVTNDPVKVVLSKGALLRIHLSPQAGWVARNVTARVEFQSELAGELDPLMVTGLIKQASTDAQFDSTLNVAVPAGYLLGDAQQRTGGECGVALDSLVEKGRLVCKSPRRRFIDRRNAHDL